MVNEYRCPENIVKLFDDPATISDGRKLAVEWASGVIDTALIGDILFMPDAETGELISFTKTGRPQ